MINNGIDFVRVREICSSGAGRLGNDFSVQRHTNVRINRFPLSRKNTYRELRYAHKSGYESAEAFLVDSVFTEAFPEEAGFQVSREQLKAQSCSETELKGFYKEFEKQITDLPTLPTVESSIRIHTGFD